MLTLARLFSFIEGSSSSGINIEDASSISSDECSESDAADSGSSKENHPPNQSKAAAADSIDEQFQALLSSMVREARAKDQAEIERLQIELTVKAAAEHSARALSRKLRADLTKVYGKMKDVGDDLGQISDDIDMNFANVY